MLDGDEMREEEECTCALERGENGVRTIDGLTDGGIPPWSDDGRILGRNAVASPAMHAATARLRTEVVLGESKTRT